MILRYSVRVEPVRRPDGNVYHSFLTIGARISLSNSDEDWRLLLQNVTLSSTKHHADQSFVNSYIDDRCSNAGGYSPYERGCTRRLHLFLTFCSVWITGGKLTNTSSLAPAWRGDFLWYNANAKSAWSFITPRWNVWFYNISWNGEKVQIYYFNLTLRCKC